MSATTAPRKFVLRIAEVDEFPDAPAYQRRNEVGYAFASAPSLTHLARMLAAGAQMETFTDDGVYYPDQTSLPPRSQE